MCVFVRALSLTLWVVLFQKKLPQTPFTSLILQMIIAIHYNKPNKHFFIYTFVTLLYSSSHSSSHCLYSNMAGSTQAGSTQAGILFCGHQICLLPSLQQTSFSSVSPRTHVHTQAAPHTYRHTQGHINRHTHSYMHTNTCTYMHTDTYTHMHTNTYRQSLCSRVCLPH